MKKTSKCVPCEQGLILETIHKVCILSKPYDNQSACENLKTGALLEQYNLKTYLEKAKTVVTGDKQALDVLNSLSID